jgi:hypothetical protein
MAAVLKFKAMPEVFVELNGKTVDDILNGNSKSVAIAFRGIKKEVAASKNSMCFAFVEVHIDGVYDDVLSGEVTAQLEQLLFPVPKHPIDDVTWARAQKLISMDPEERKQAQKETRRAQLLLDAVDPNGVPETTKVKLPKQEKAAKVTAPKPQREGKPGPGYAETVRQIIRDNPTAGEGALLELVVIKTRLPLGKATAYVRDNIPRVRG